MTTDQEQLAHLREQLKQARERQRLAAMIFDYDEVNRYWNTILYLHGKIAELERKVKKEWNSEHVS